jgi:hypothetical protein
VTLGLPSTGLVLLLVLASTAEARAADVCLSAPVEGQKLQRAGNLMRARERFAQCAQKACPPQIVQDCTQWSQDVERALPSVVVAARGAQGEDIVDARVSIDGQPPVLVTARAIELDPGPHHFVFSHAASPDVSIDALLREGEKNREIRATLRGEPAPARPPPSDSISIREGEAVRIVPPASLIAGGLAVGGLGVFAVLGTMGVVRRGNDHCATGCLAADKNSVDADFVAADVGLGVGLVATGVAAWLYLARPKAARAPTALFDVSPSRTGALATFGLRF